MVECDDDDDEAEAAPKEDPPSLSQSPNPSTSRRQPESSGPINGARDAPTRRRHATAYKEQDSSSDDNASDFEGSHRPLNADSDSDEMDERLPKIKAQILDFFQRATVDELALIAGCSLKKAQKIIELRPYQTWNDLVSDSSSPLHFFLLSSL